MPNRETHQALTIACAAVSIPAILFIPLDAFIAAEVGILMTLLPELTPDLDVSTRKFSIIQDLIGLKAYARIIPHRYGARSRHWRELGEEKTKWWKNPKHWSRLRIWNILFFSHLPFIGTFIRTLLCMLPLAIICMILGVSSEVFWQSSFWYFFWVWLGMGWSDCWHLIADKPWSKYGDHKETRKEFWYGKRGEQRKIYRKTRRV